jgi:N-acetylmuramoyl-L-alanine amidase
MPTNSYRLRLFVASLLIAFLECTTFSTAQARRASKDSGSGATVVIDAGHGGYDRGGIPGQTVADKEMTLDVAQRLKKVLAASGYRVVMTRDGDVFVPLGTRVAIANSYSNAIFVSIHFNSAKRSGAGGIET